MKALISISMLLAAMFAATIESKENAPATLNIGVVNFSECIISSKYGQQERKQLEALQNQLQRSLKDLEEQLLALKSKLEDNDYINSLNPIAESDHKMKYQELAEELQRRKTEYYQALQQANMQSMQTMADYIKKSSEIVASQENLSLIINKDAVFHLTQGLNVTSEVIKVLDESYEKDQAILNIEPPKLDAMNQKSLIQ